MYRTKAGEADLKLMCEILGQDRLLTYRLGAFRLETGE